MLARIPLRLAIGNDPPVCAVTTDMNRRGSLVLSPISIPLATVLWIQPEQSRIWTRARVVWSLPHLHTGLHQLGVEFIDDAADLVKPRGRQRDRRGTAISH
jgi:hypothetical protein